VKAVLFSPKPQKTEKANIMKTVLVTAYNVNPFNKTEDHTAWNFILQIAYLNKVIAVTCKNNKEHIERYWNEYPELQHLKENIQFLYFDWPKFIIFWKKGIFLSTIYFYFWQMTVALWLITKKLAVDIVHDLNLNNDWTPSFLWLLGKPFIWGPVGHNSKIPGKFLLKDFGCIAVLKNRLPWILKSLSWNFDPFLLVCKSKANHILCANLQASKKLRLKEGQFSIVHSVAAITSVPRINKHDTFKVLSVGRFIHLKGFDVTIRAFASFYHQLNENEKAKTKLVLVGSGPLKKFIQRLIKKENIQCCTEVLEYTSAVELYETASVFLFPSHESTGIEVAEAMSYCLPVLCWKNYHGDFVHSASNLSINYRTYKAGVARFARRLKQLYIDKEHYYYEQQLAKERFEDSFSWNARGTQLNNIYESVLAKDRKHFNFAINTII
jgi:glycosyltransferase involved in cell wall biosynthesis